MTSSKKEKSPSDAVAGRLEMTLYAATAMHDLIVGAMQTQVDQPFGDVSYYFMILREGLRTIARDMENCVETLSEDHRRLGFFEDHYGTV